MVCGDHVWNSIKEYADKSSKKFEFDKDDREIYSILIYDNACDTNKILNIKKDSYDEFKDDSSSNICGAFLRTSLYVDPNGCVRVHSWIGALRQYYHEIVERSHDDICLFDKEFVHFIKDVKRKYKFQKPNTVCVRDDPRCGYAMRIYMDDEDTVSKLREKIIKKIFVQSRFRIWKEYPDEKIKEIKNYTKTIEELIGNDGYLSVIISN